MAMNSAPGEAEVGGLWSEIHPGRNTKFLSEKQTKAKRDGDMA
jgi:hypothetical protein